MATTDELLDILMKDLATRTLYFGRLPSFPFDFHLVRLLQTHAQLLYHTDLVPCPAGTVKREEGVNPSLSRNCNRR